MFAGFWKCQDGAQQQFQPVRKVHPSQLQGEWNGSWVRYNQSAGMLYTIYLIPGTFGSMLFH